MKIIVETKDLKNIRLYFPTGLVLNRLTALIASKTAEKNGNSLSFDQACCFISALKDFKRKHGKWTLVEVETASGDHVEITI